MPNPNKKSILQIFFDFAKEGTEEKLKLHFKTIDHNFNLITADELITKNEDDSYLLPKGSADGIVQDWLDRNGFNIPGGVYIEIPAEKLCDKYPFLPNFKNIKYLDNEPLDTESDPSVVYIYEKNNTKYFAYQKKGKIVSEPIENLKSAGIEVDKDEKNTLTKETIEKINSKQVDENTCEARFSLLKLFRDYFFYKKSSSCENIKDDEKLELINITTSHLQRALGVNPHFVMYVLSFFHQNASQPIGKSEEKEFVRNPDALGSQAMVSSSAFTSFFRMSFLTRDKTFENIATNTHLKLSEDSNSVIVTSTTYGKITSLPIKIEAKFRIQLTNKDETPIETILEDVKFSSYKKDELTDEGLSTPNQDKFLNEEEASKVAFDLLTIAANPENAEDIFEELKKERDRDTALSFLVNILVNPITLTSEENASKKAVGDLFQKLQKKYSNDAAIVFLTAIATTKNKKTGKLDAKEKFGELFKTLKEKVGSSTATLFFLNMVKDQNTNAIFLALQKKLDNKAVTSMLFDVVNNKNVGVVFKSFKENFGNDVTIFFLVNMANDINAKDIFITLQHELGHGAAMTFLEALKSRALNTENLLPENIKNGIFSAINDIEKDLSEKLLTRINGLLPQNKKINGENGSDVVLTIIDGLMKKPIYDNLSLSTKKKVIDNVLIYMGVNEKDLFNPYTVYAAINRYNVVKNTDAKREKIGLDGEKKVYFLKQYFFTTQKERMDLAVNNVMNGDAALEKVYDEAKGFFDSYWKTFLATLPFNQPNDATIVSECEKALLGFIKDSSLSESFIILITSRFFEQFYHKYENFLNTEKGLNATRLLLVSLTEGKNFELLSQEQKDILFKGFTKHLCHHDYEFGKALKSGVKIFTDLINNKSAHPWENARNFLSIAFPGIFKEIKFRLDLSTDRIMQKISTVIYPVIAPVVYAAKWLDSLPEKTTTPLLNLITGNKEEKEEKRVPANKTNNIGSSYLLLNKKIDVKVNNKDDNFEKKIVDLNNEVEKNNNIFNENIKNIKENIKENDREISIENVVVENINENNSKISKQNENNGSIILDNNHIPISIK